MSHTNCHFDGDCCAKKSARFHAWQKVILQSNGVIQINPDALSECPIADENERKKACDRYCRYLFVIKNANSNIINER